MRTPRRLALIGATTALLLSSAGIAAADDIYNKLDATIDADAELMPLDAGGPNGTTTLAVFERNDDGKNGCNLTGNVGDLVLDVVSSDPDVATVSPSRITISNCGATAKLTVTPGAAGEATISLKEVSDGTQRGFNLDPATFTVKVNATANTAPVVKVTGATHGASYDKGTVPAAVCEVTDKEDGNSSFPASLSAITGPYAVDGIGSQTATCDHMDRGGLRAVASATYSIVDPTAPEISYTLDPAEPDGDNGWYTGDVSLTWHVTETDSPSSLQKTGCEDTTVTTDQEATTYTCSATSAGGSAAEQSVTIARDGTAPTVVLDRLEGTQGNNGWYTSDVTAYFAATDATSGLDTESGTATSNGEEGSGIVLDSPAFTDRAGNRAEEGAASTTVKVDKTKPTVGLVGGPAAASYYYGQVPAEPTCTASDATSGLDGDCEVTHSSSDSEDPYAVGEHTWTATATDMAGHVSTATVTYKVLAWTHSGFFNPVNMGGTLNTVKAGSTVPLKFRVYAGPTELTDTAVVESFTSRQVSCTSVDNGVSDAIEVTTTGGTSLRYDSTGGQFVNNWQTPKAPGSCYQVTMTTQDGTALKANFKLK